MTIKRVIDILMSAFLIILFAPLFCLISLLIKIDSAGPIIFKQARIGKNSYIFNILKFRTMIDNAERIGSGLKTCVSDPRITRIGKILRKTSLDELPQLFNIIRGDMSFVGPRPAPVVLINKMTDHEKKRLRIRPGLTGWAQINGRTSISWKDKYKLDIWYYENYSVLLDLKIILKTILYVIFSKDIYSKQYEREVTEKNKNLNEYIRKKDEK